MSELLTAVLMAWAAGITAFAGGGVACLERVRESRAKREVVHGIVAFGGGILVAAVAFALTPDAIERLSPEVLFITFCLGGMVFCVLDAWISRGSGNMAQFMAMLLDFVPEALALGAVFGHDAKQGVLLALFISAQNLPEGFNSFRDMTCAGTSRGKALGALLAVSVLGPAAAFLGYTFLEPHPEWTAGIMGFAAGGILYLVFQDIAPQAAMRRRWTPPLGAVLGFAVGMLGHQVVG